MIKGEVKLRLATVSDVATIIHHRRSMFAEMGFREKANLDAMEATAAPFIKTGLENGSYHGWLMESGGSVIAGGGVVVVGFPPSPRDMTAHRAWIMNMYTEPEYRGAGLARGIMEAMILWCREQGFMSVSLHASDAGRHLYETLGFTPTNEMRLPLPQFRDAADK